VSARTILRLSWCSIRSACRNAQRSRRRTLVEALGVEPLTSIAFEPRLFGTAANNGQMIGQVSAKARSAEAFAHIAQTLGGREQPKRRKLGLNAGLLKLLRGKGRGTAR
jgi:pilus assembly protein CpaE